LFLPPNSFDLNFVYPKAECEGATLTWQERAHHQRNQINEEAI